VFSQFTSTLILIRILLLIILSSMLINYRILWHVMPWSRDKACSLELEGECRHWYLVVGRDRLLEWYVRMFVIG